MDCGSAVAAVALVLLVVTLGRPLRARNQVRRGESLPDCFTR